MENSARRARGLDAHEIPVYAPPAPRHWINTEPVESSDKPCQISSLDLRVHVCGLYADVTETLVISNPNRRDISVGLAIALPDRAVVSGYALDIDGQMVDGVVVPKEKARVAFETEQRIGADPGLVESVKGNVYRTRVYPVPRRRTRTVRLRYVAPLLVVDGRAAFLDAPMPAERLANRAVRIEVELLDCPMPALSGVNGAQFKERGVSWTVESRERNVLAGQGIRVALPQLPTSFSLVERDETGALWFAASERVPQDAPQDVPALSSLTVLWDTSGSRAGVDHQAEFELLRGYCAGGGIGQYRLITFGDRAQPMLESGEADTLLAHLASLRYDGGTDFQALSAALAELPDGADGAACVLFTDGLDTLGAEPLAFPQGCKVLAVVSGGQRDAESLRQACGGLAFDLMTAPKDIDALARALFCPRLLAGVEGEGVAEVLGIGSGHDGRFSVVGKLVSPAAGISFANTGTRFALDGQAARPGATMSRAWAAMRVAQLSPRADENAEELLSLGRRFGVVSPATSLLVLETLDQWMRYDIEPPTTWESMHSAWELHRQGLMGAYSDEARIDEHLRNLKRAWSELKEWWARDYPVARPTPPAHSLFCMMCGSRIEAGDGFCRHCGAQVPGFRDGERDGAPIPRRARRAPAPEPLSAPIPMAFGSSMPDADYMAMECASPSIMCSVDSVSGWDDAAEVDDGAGGATAASIVVQPWMPNADYLAALDAALREGRDAAHDAYFAQRAQHAASPSFFIDCAGWFVAHDDDAFGLRVLSNLAELRIEDAALLRVMAWRLREAGELERALAVLRRVLKLRPEDSQSHRDLALVLDELARTSFDEGDERAARDFAEEAGAFYRKIAQTPWQRRAESIGLFAVEEYNVLRAWADAQTWENAPKLETLGEEFEGVLDCDLRITLAWDADETDVDLHVTEPGGEEAYYANRLTYAGGRVSEDITDGYGPELYEIRHANDGVYTIRAHYYASHQQTVFGPASCTLTVYTDWGRPTQKQQVTSTRLEQEREMAFVGTAAYGKAATEAPAPAPPDAGEPALVKGTDASVLVAAYGAPAEGDPAAPNGQLSWCYPGGRIRIATIADGKVSRVVERMPWGEEMIIVQ